MAPKDPKEIEKRVREVALPALRRDAGEWRKSGDALTLAANDAATHTFAPGDFSYFGEVAGLYEIYSKLQTKVVRLLNEGATQFHAIGGALDSAANQYEQDENNAVHRNLGVW
jgi:hypothetical protein